MEKQQVDLEAVQKSMKKQQEEIEAIKADIKEKQQVLESLNYAQPEQKDGQVDINEEVLTPY